MKVLLTHERFLPDFAGGGEYIAFETAKGLIGRGVDVQVLTTGNPRIAEYDGVPTLRLPTHRYRLNLAVRKIVEAGRGADLIQTFNYHACLPSLLAGWMLRIPVVCVVLGLFQEAWKDMRSFPAAAIWTAWERFLVRRKFDRLVFLSSHSCQAALGLGVQRERTAVISPGIDLSAYFPDPQKDDVVFFAGKLDVRKGIYDLIEIARALPKVRFRVIGWGPQEGQIRKQAPSNVEVIPFRTGEPLQELFRKARIFFFPTYSETFGLVIVEAMASGCAIISTSPLEFAGIRVPAGDRKAMVEAVQRLYYDREVTERMGCKNHELASFYNWNRYTDDLMCIYAELTK